MTVEELKKEFEYYYNHVNLAHHLLEDDSEYYIRKYSDWLEQKLTESRTECEKHKKAVNWLVYFILSDSSKQLPDEELLRKWAYEGQG